MKQLVLLILCASVALGQIPQPARATDFVTEAGNSLDSIALIAKRADSVAALGGNAAAHGSNGQVQYKQGSGLFSSDKFRIDTSATDGNGHKLTYLTLGKMGTNWSYGGIKLADSTFHWSIIPGYAVSNGVADHGLWIGSNWNGEDTNKVRWGQGFETYYYDTYDTTSEWYLQHIWGADNSGSKVVRRPIQVNVFYGNSSFGRGYATQISFNDGSIRMDSSQLEAGYGRFDSLLVAVIRGLDSLYVTNRLNANDVRVRSAGNGIDFGRLAYYTKTGELQATVPSIAINDTILYVHDLTVSGTVQVNDQITVYGPASLNGSAGIAGTATVGKLKINGGALIDSAKVVADTLKFYVGGVGYKAVKE